MTAPTGWPGAPGVPLHPERDGWHWLLANSAKGPQPEAVCWRAPRGAMLGVWFCQGREDWLTVGEMTPARGWLGYLGPCHTPAEVAALVQAGQEAMRKAAVEVARQEANSFNSEETADYRDGAHNAAVEIWRTLQGLPLPSAPAALARIEAEAEARGMERAAAWHDEQATDHRKRADRWAQGSIERDRHNYIARQHDGHAAAVRARAMEAGDE